MPEGPLAPYQITVPTQDCAGLEQEEYLVQFGFRAGAVSEACEFSSKNCQSELLTARGMRRLGMVAFQDEQLVAEQQDLQILMVVRTVGSGNEVEQTGEEVCE
jgi:hypothetical protein